MKKNIFIVILIFIIFISFSACSNVHEHIFSAEWAYDETHHWHNATCGDTNEINSYGMHSFDATDRCFECGYKKNSQVSGVGNENKKIVTFNTVDGDKIYEPRQFEVGKVMVDLPIPQKEGYIFKGWIDELGERYTSESVMPNKNLSLIAKWEKEPGIYNDKYVTFKPSNEGWKSESIRNLYEGQVDKALYIELTSDDLGGPSYVGKSNNFTLRTVEGMDYYLKNGYTWMWFQGSFNNPNGAQRFTLGYGSNIQLVSIYNHSGVSIYTYLVDIYVKQDYYLNLYSDIYSKKYYDRIRVTENEKLPEVIPTYKSNGYEKFDFDCYVYYNNETHQYEKFSNSTLIVKDWNIYQTYKPFKVNIDLSGGDLNKNTSAFTITPYNKNIKLSTPTKEGYDFIGWQFNDIYFTDEIGDSGINYLDVTKAKYVLTAKFIAKRLYYYKDKDGINEIHRGEYTTPIIKYTDESKNEIASIDYVIDNKSIAENNLIVVGQNITLNGSRLGCDFLGWFDKKKDILLSDHEDFNFVIPNSEFSYVCKYKAKDEMSIFDFDSDSMNCAITGIKNKSVTNIEVPSYVNEIGLGAFKECENLESLTLPFLDNNLGYIFGTSNYDFNGKYVPKTLKEVIITGGKSISNWAFAFCENVQSVKLSNSIENIGQYAFRECGQLKNLFLCSGRLQSIDQHAFIGCSNLINVFFDGELKDWCNIKFETISSNPCYYAENIYYNNNAVTEIIIPDDITVLNNYIFCGFKHIEKIIVGSHVKAIGKGAFAACNSLKNLTIPFVGAARNGKENKFFGYMFGASNADEGNGVPKSLKSVVITDDSVIIDKAFYKCSDIESIVLPDKVTDIGEFAFFDCQSLKSFALPINVKNVGLRAFGGCSGLEKVNFMGDINSWCKINFRNSDANPLSYAHNLYLGEALLTDLIIPNGITTIKQYAFSGCDSIKKINFSIGINSIEDGAFEDCHEIQDIKFPEQLVSIGSNSFANCNSLIDLFIPEKVEKIGYGAFRCCNSLSKIEVSINNDIYYSKDNCLIQKESQSLLLGCKNSTIPNNVLKIDAYAFDSCSDLDSIEIPSSVTSIGIYAFANCINLLNITIPDNVTIIKGSAFSGCTSLASVVIGKKVNTIEMSAFSGCYALVEIYNLSSLKIYKGGNDPLVNGSIAYNAIVIYSNKGTESKISVVDNYIFYVGSTVYLIGYKGLPFELVLPKDYNGQKYSIYNCAFKGCDSLKKLIIPDGVMSIGDEAFWGCTNLENVTIGNGITSIGDYVFLSCENLKTAIIGDSVSKIGGLAFSSCANLEFLVLPSSLKSVGNNMAEAFSGCYKLKKVFYKGNATMWGQIKFSIYGCDLKSVDRFYFSENQPSNEQWRETTKWWHYDSDGKTVLIWEK